MTCKGDAVGTLFNSDLKVRNSPHIFADVHGGVPRVVFD